MVIFDSNDSPFLVLWYFYLAFLSAVIVVNVVVFALKSLIGWRTKNLLRGKTAVPVKSSASTLRKAPAKAAKPVRKVLT